MNQHKGLLLVLLLAQLALAAWLYFGKAGSADSTQGLAKFDVAAVSAIAITDAKDNRLQLERTEAGWRVGQYPADSAKVDAMLAKLSAVQAPWPVATSSDAATRFEVTPDKFQRRLQLYQQELLLADLMFGTSPGFRRVHARAVAAEDIYSIDFANHELPIGEDDWLDRSLLAAQGEIVSVQRMDHWSLVQTEPPASIWELNGGPADPAAAATLVGRFTNLQVLGSVVFEGQLTATFVVTARSDADTQEYRYALYHNAEMDKYYATRDDQAGRFEIAGYIAEQLLLGPEAWQPEAETAEQTPTAQGLSEQIVDQALQDLSAPAAP